MSRATDLRRAALCGALVAGALLVGAPRAAAESATQEEVRELAVEARSDPAALEELRAIDEVDGRPVDLGAALDGATGDDLTRRLDELVAAPAGGDSAATAADERGEAADILDGRKYNPAELPKPFEGPLQWIGDRLEPVFEPVGDLLGAIGDEPILLVAIGGAIVALGVLASSRLASRRTGLDAQRAARPRRAASEDPAALERLADEAEAAGDHRTAYRLRFRAGVLRLAALGTVPYRPSMTTLTLAGLVRSTRFDHLADEFDEVAYGERPVSTAELDAARQEWARVLQEARQS